MRKVHRETDTQEYVLSVVGKSSLATTAESTATTDPTNTKGNHEKVLVYCSRRSSADPHGGDTLRRAFSVRWHPRNLDGARARVGVLEVGEPTKQAAIKRQAKEVDHAAADEIDGFTTAQLGLVHLQQQTDGLALLELGGIALHENAFDLANFF